MGTRHMAAWVRLAFSFVLFVLLLGVHAPTWAAPSDKLDPGLSVLGPMDEARVIVRLKGGADHYQLREKYKGFSRQQRKKGVVKEMRDKADAVRKGLAGLIKDGEAQGLVSDVRPLWVVNGLSMSARRVFLDDLAKRPVVERIYPDEKIAFSDTTFSTMAVQGQNLTVINAPALWGMGYTGQGTVVASMDTGVDVQHPALAPAYRGGTNSWYDPYSQHATPFDYKGHGTATTGVMVGKTPDGTAIGVAPGAKWIAAKVFNDSGNASVSAIHSAYQWALDPDGNPATDDAPDIVNNSWGNVTTGVCDTEFAPDIAAFRAAGILPVYAGGNSGPLYGTSASPANNAGSLSVGATDLADSIVPSSSRGPSACDGSIFPLLTAPGWDIYTTDRSFGGNQNYVYVGGTSFAAPHVSGAAALLLSAYPNMGVAQIEQALISSARDLGQPGPDNTYGNGRIDALGAYQATYPVNVSAYAADGTEGVAQQVNAAWSDLNGAGDIRLAFLQIGTGSVIKVKYDHSNGLLYMLNDAGSAWLGGYAPGSQNTITGKNGALDCSKTTVTPDGTGLAVSFNITPLAGFFGAKDLYLYAYDNMLHTPKGWEVKGTWNIASLNPMPVNVSVAAATGNEGVGQQVLARWSHAGGADKLRLLFLQVGNAASGGIMKFRYDRPKDLLYALNNAGNAWLGGYAPGSANTINTLAGALDCSKTTVSAAGDVLSVGFSVAPAMGYTGNKPLFQFAYDTGGNSTPAWSFKGNWRIKTTPPESVSVAAADGKTGAAQQVSATWRDINGASDINIVYLQVGTNAGGGFMKLRYDRAANKLYVLNAAGNAWLGGFPPGSANTITGMYGTLGCAATTVTQSVIDLTVGFNITPAAGYTGSKPVFMYAYDNDMNHTPTWELRGTWNISAP